MFSNIRKAKIIRIKSLKKILKANNLIQYLAQFIEYFRFYSNSNYRLNLSVAQILFVGIFRTFKCTSFF